MPPTLKSWRGILLLAQGCMRGFVGVSHFCAYSTVTAAVLKFHIWFPHKKIADMYVFMPELQVYPIMELWPLENLRKK